MTSVLHGCDMWTSAGMEVVVEGSGLEPGNYFLQKCKAEAALCHVKYCFLIFPSGACTRVFPQWYRYDRDLRETRYELGFLRSVD